MDTTRIAGGVLRGGGGWAETCRNITLRVPKLSVAMAVAVAVVGC